MATARELVLPGTFGSARAGRCVPGSTAPYKARVPVMAT